MGEVVYLCEWLEKRRRRYCGNCLHFEREMPHLGKCTVRGLYSCKMQVCPLWRPFMEG